MSFPTLAKKTGWSSSSHPCCTLGVISHLPLSTHALCCPRPPRGPALSPEPRLPQPLLRVTHYTRLGSLDTSPGSRSRGLGVPAGHGRNTRLCSKV